MLDGLQFEEDKAPIVDAGDVARLVAILQDGRMNGADIACRMFGTTTETLKRKVRAIAKAARPRVVSFPGSNGYALWEHCTVEEILHGIEALESQAKEMIREANLFRMHYHSRYRGGEPKPKDDPNQMALYE